MDSVPPGALPEESWSAADRRPIAGTLLAALVFAVPCENMLVFPTLGVVTSVVGAGAAVAVAGAVIVRDRIRRPSTPVLGAIAFAMWTTASVMWSADSGVALTRAATTSQLALMVWLVWEVCGRGDEWWGRLCAAYVGGAAVSAAATLISFGLGDSAYGLRYVAPGFDPNDLSVTLALAVPMAVHRAQRTRSRFAATAFGALVPVFTAAIVLTGSRGGTLAAGVAGILVLGPILRTPLRAKAALAVTAACCVAAARSMLPAFTIARLMSIRGELLGGDLTGRVAIWSAGLAAFQEHALFGVGAGGFPRVVAPALGKEWVAHSTLLSVAVELGAIGLMLFLLCWAAALARVVVRRRFVWLACALTATWAVGASALSWELRKPTWLVIALIACMGSPNAPVHRWPREARA